MIIKKFLEYKGWRVCCDKMVDAISSQVVEMNDKYKLRINAYNYRASIHTELTYCPYCGIKIDIDVYSLYGVPIEFKDYVGSDDVLVKSPGDLSGFVEVDSTGRVVRLTGKFYKFKLSTFRKIFEAQSSESEGV